MRVCPLPLLLFLHPLTLIFLINVLVQVKGVAHRFLRGGYPMVDTVGESDTATNPQVRRMPQLYAAS